MNKSDWQLALKWSQARYWNTPVSAKRIRKMAGRVLTCTMGSRVRGAKLKQALDGNMARIFHESSYRPGVTQQGFVDVNTGVDEAIGLYQITPSTWQVWSIPGFTNMHNPFDQIMTAMNVQLNNVHHFFSTTITGGWGPAPCPPGDGNPYRNGRCNK
jgi:hypothetical protein